MILLTRVPASDFAGDATRLGVFRLLCRMLYVVNLLCVSHPPMVITLSGFLIFHFVEHVDCYF